MTFEEAIVAIKARAPLEEFRRQAAERQATAGREEEFAYLFAKWTKKNATDEELAAIGLIR